MHARLSVYARLSTRVCVCEIIYLSDCLSVRKQACGCYVRVDRSV